MKLVLGLVLGFAVASAAVAMPAPARGVSPDTPVVVSAAEGASMQQVAQKKKKARKAQPRKGAKPASAR